MLIKIMKPLRKILGITLWMLVGGIIVMFLPANWGTLTSLFLFNVVDSPYLSSSTNPSSNISSLPYHMVYEEHIIHYNDSDMTWNSPNLKYTLQNTPYDLNGDGIIDQNDISVSIANEQLNSNQYSVDTSQSNITVYIPYGSLSVPIWNIGSIVKIYYGQPNNPTQ